MTSVCFEVTCIFIGIVLLYRQVWSGAYIDTMLVLGINILKFMQCPSSVWKGAAHLRDEQVFEC